MYIENWFLQRNRLYCVVFRVLGTPQPQCRMIYRPWTDSDNNWGHRGTKLKCCLMQKAVKGSTRKWYCCVFLNDPIDVTYKASCPSRHFMVGWWCGLNIIFRNKLHTCLITRFPIQFFWYQTQSTKSTKHLLHSKVCTILVTTKKHASLLRCSKNNTVMK